MSILFYIEKLKLKVNTCTKSNVSCILFGHSLSKYYLLIANILKASFNMFYLLLRGDTHMAISVHHSLLFTSTRNNFQNLWYDNSCSSLLPIFRILLWFLFNMLILIIIFEFKSSLLFSRYILEADVL
ncbi:hypothetical protein AABB24_017515 [Solanum stoloniferum]|uniref:Uncharacterized protein n=1 Tax=Solanum stoloniferum TaxID=62892 RepID=A0ABD2TKG8_9SOLN